MSNNENIDTLVNYLIHIYDWITHKNFYLTPFFKGLNLTQRLKSITYFRGYTKTAMNIDFVLTLYLSSVCLLM